MDPARILLQLDSDRHSSSFDAVVAVDAGVDQLLQYSGVTPQEVTPLVHGAIFTRGPSELKSTAIFVGGADVAAGEKLLAAVTGSFFGPMRVSAMLDANGANTTAAAAVIAAGRHIALSEAKAAVLAATGAVGQRVVQLLAGAGSKVFAGSRSRERAEGVCTKIRERHEQADLEAFAAEDTDKVLQQVDVVISAGAAGIQLLSASQRGACQQLRVAIDLNAVPPLGLEGIGVTDKAKEVDGVICYGAIGVGGTKMKIHKAAIQRLFAANDQVLDAAEIYAIGCDLESG